MDHVITRTVSSVMNLRASATGPAGTELPLNNSASEVFCTMKRSTLATGQRPLKDARNTVRLGKKKNIYI